MTTSNRLAEIIAHKRREAEALEPHAAELRKIALQRNEFRGFRRLLFEPGATRIVAEIKRASPSAGVIAGDFDPIQQARAYERGGARALSILTDRFFFQGCLDDMTKVRAEVELPVLRKDFIVTIPQIYESAACGADAILLIVAALDDEELRCLYDTARAIQLDVVVEVHDMAEMDRALDLGADIIGINNRNLKTFKVSLQTVELLAPEIPADCLGIAESGIKTAEDIRFCKRQGIDCFLIGETLMRSHDPAETLRSFMEVP
jgi:indole-3-glycerol phosphate synthase